MEKKNSLNARNLFLALAALTWGTGGAVLCVMTVLLGKALLPEWLEKVYMFLGGLFALLFITLYFCLGSREDRNRLAKIRRHWPEAMESELWILAVYYLWKFGEDVWEILCGRYVQNDVLRIFVSVLLTLAAVFAAGVFLRRLLKNFGPGGIKKGLLHILLTFAVLLLSLIVMGLLTALWRLAAGLTELSVIGMFGFHVFRAICAYGMIQILQNVLCREAKEEQAPVPQEAQAAPLARRLIGVGIPLVASVVLILATGGFFSVDSAVERAVAAVKDPISEGYAGLEEGSLEDALACFERAEGRMQAFRCLASEEAAESIRTIYREYPYDSVIGALYLSETDDVETVEDAVRNYSVGSEWYPVLLRYYDGQRKLTDAQERLREDMLLQCIASGRYTVGDCVFTRDLRGNKIELRQELRDYEEAMQICGVLRMVVRYGREGTYTKEMAYEALELAEEYPDNLLMQYAACQIAGNYQEDSAGHYQRTVEAAARFDKLYDNRARTDAQIVNEKRFLGDVAANCYEYETALAYYEESYQLSRDAVVALSCAKIYDRLGNYEQCAQMAEEILQKEPDNGQALYLKAVSSLKTRDVDAALEAAGHLGDIVADPDRSVDVAEENYLYTCAQYLAMRDNSSWTDYTWSVYDSLSEEQAAAVQSHKLLWDYMTAVSQCFMKRDYESAAQAVENILEERDDLPMGWYLRGTIAFEQKDFGRAVEYFGKAIDCGGAAPALYFSMANAYEAMEDYENAWIYSRMVEEMLPYQDHGNDVYGISIHNKRLLSALEGKVRR